MHIARTDDLSKLIIGIMFVTDLVNVGEMSSRFRELDYEALNAMYENERQKLTDALLKGSSWEEVQDQRRLVTSLAIERHKKWKQINPAENEIRRSPEP